MPIQSKKHLSAAVIGGDRMQYAIVITSHDEIEVREYKDYHSINDYVEGWYERCGTIGILDKMCFVFCNEEFLFQDDLAFNAMATAICNQPIYGNVAILQDGYNSDGERDSLPIDKQTAEIIKCVLCEMKAQLASVFDDLRSKFSDNKPSPTFQIITGDELSQTFDTED